MSVADMRPEGIMSPEASLDVPTYRSTFTDTSAYAVLTAKPTSIQHASSPITTDPTCSLCDDSMPGIQAGPPTYTASYPTHAPTSPVTGGFYTLGATSRGVAWYQQAWTLPVALLLCCYAMFSCVLLGVLLYTGRLDLHGNLHVGRLGRIYRERRGFYNERMSVWTSGLSTWEDTAPYRLETPEEVEARVREQRGTARISASVTHEAPQVPSSRTSVAETEPLRADDGPPIELQIFPAGVGGERHYVFYRGDDRRVVRVTGDGVVPYATDAERMRLRHVATREQYERQAHMLRMHHLNELQASMARAGWM
ncbi:hypothetical protein B0A55_08423 [Friedmanniomyces simplex]|uniref:Uncharacterized protein n=1 Tax=Friedmanniomyces simplex TaxID=329884 RepID=A0A4U0WS09_9PEZI|nr:hypothetical protein B0A55_08423 [Friedmanniomyces simplex]